MSSSWCRWDNTDLILNVTIQPRASRDEIIQDSAGDRLKIRITAPPVDGKANTHLIRFLADVFGVAKSNITLIAGETGRKKRLRIHAPRILPPYIAAAVPDT